MIRRLLARRRFMRDHDWTQAHLSDYLDDELGASDHARLHAHVGVCPQCRRLLATLRRTLEGLRALSTEPGAGVADGVIERLRSGP
jgi:anti-sigma factor RsiW